MQKTPVALPLTIWADRAAGFPQDGLCEVHTWRDLSGRVCAHGYVGGDVRWMRWPGVVAFRFDSCGRIDAFPEPGIPAVQVLDLCRRSVEPIVRQALGWETLHASAVRFDAGVVAFCGEREAGKSTIAYSFGRRGFAQYADDAVVVQVDSGDVRALDLPFGVRLRAEAAHFYGFQTAASGPLHDVVPMTLAGADVVGTSPLAAIFVLARKPDGPPELVRLAPAAAFTAILAHAHCFAPDDQDERRRLLENYLVMADSVPVYDLRFSAGLDRLDAVLDCIASAVGHTSSAQCGSR